MSRRSAQATVGKGLAQGLYIRGGYRAGIEPTTLRLKVIDSTNAPPRPTFLLLIFLFLLVLLVFILLFLFPFPFFLLLLL